MNKKLLMLGIILVSLTLISAGQSMGTFKQGEIVRVTETCADATYITISSISAPDSTVKLSDKNMTSYGSGEFYYNFNSTSQIGIYEVRVYSDGCENTAVYNFEITPSGFTGTLGFYIVLLALVGGLIMLGFQAEEYWFLVMAGMGLIMIGIYSINYGVAGFRDMFMTWGVGLFEIGVGAILSIGAGIQKMYND